MPKGEISIVNRRTDNALATGKGTKQWATKWYTENYRLCNPKRTKPGVNSSAPGGLVISVPLVAPVVLLLLKSVERRGCDLTHTKSNRPSIDQSSRISWCCVFGEFFVLKDTVNSLITFKMISMGTSVDTPAIDVSITRLIFSPFTKIVVFLLSLTNFSTSLHD